MDSAFENIIKILDDEKINYVLHSHPPVVSVDDVVKNVDYDYSCGFKTLAFSLNDRYVFVAIHAFDRIDYKKLSKALNVKRNDIKQADFDEIAENFGYMALSPISFSPNVSVYIDQKIQTYNKVFCGVGDNTKTLEINSKDLIQISHATIFDLVKETVLS